MGAGVLALAAALALGPAVWAQPAAPRPGPGGDKPYVVENGAVDRGTYNGYRRYHGHCHRCHGPDGLGSMYGPALLESMKHMSYRRFVDITLEGNPEMPGFADDPNVAKHVDDMYAYLKARADGVLGRGRPDKLWRR